MELNEEQLKELREALMSAFPDQEKLEQMLFDQLDERLDIIFSVNNRTPILVEELVKILANQVCLSNISSQVYLANIARASNLPNNIAMNLAAALTGNPEFDARTFIQRSIAQGVNPQDPSFTTLESILNSGRKNGWNITKFIVAKLINWAKSQGRLEELVRGAVLQNPYDKKLQEFIENLDIKLLLIEEDLKDYISSEGTKNFDFLKKLESFLPRKAYDHLQKERDILKDDKIPNEIKIIILAKIQREYQKKPRINADSPQQVQPYLLMIFQQTCIQNECQVNAFLVFEDSTKEYSGNVIRIRNLNNKTRDSTNQEIFLHKFTEKKLNQEINQFINDSYKEMNLKKKEGYSVNELIVEFVLPNEYIFESIDMWKNPINQSEFGLEYRIVVRAWERFNPNNMQKEKFQYRLSETWNQLNHILENEKQQNIQEKVAYLAEVETKNLQVELDEKIGLKLTCVPPKTKKNARKKLLNAIFTAGVPIVIWTRCSDLPEINIATEIDKFFTIDSLKDLGTLLNLIKDERKLAAKREQFNDKHLGHHLAILYDECHRLSYLVSNQNLLGIGR